MEKLFQVTPALQPKAKLPTAPKKQPPKTLIEARKAHNISIQLRGLGLSTDEVCEALLEGGTVSLLLVMLWQPDFSEFRHIIICMMKCVACEIKEKTMHSECEIWPPESEYYSLEPYLTIEAV